MSSEPTWLDDNETISFDVDSKHMGTFSATEGRIKVFPELTAKPGRDEVSGDAPRIRPEIVGVPVGADGGHSRKLLETETGCRPGWTQRHDLDLAPSRLERIVWIEVNADSGETRTRSAGHSRLF